MDTIFHITEPSMWERAVMDGVYVSSTREASLAEVGFIHCSFTKEQVETVANYIYGDSEGPLLLLEVDPSQIQSDIRVENLDGGSEAFPHIYGPLPIAAVKGVHSLGRLGGKWTLPPSV